MSEVVEQTIPLEQKLKQLTVEELKADLAFFKYKHWLANKTLQERIESRNCTYKTLQDVWLLTKDIDSKRYLATKEIIEMFAKQIDGFTHITKVHKLRVKLIKDELSLRSNGKAKS